jgi:hypothetical protein
LAIILLSFVIILDPSGQSRKYLTKLHDEITFGRKAPSIRQELARCAFQTESSLWQRRTSLRKCGTQVSPLQRSCRKLHIHHRSQVQIHLPVKPVKKDGGSINEKKKCLQKKRKEVNLGCLFFAATRIPPSSLALRLLAG